ncbi:MAG: GGDEF domain-containing protein [Betaproteobacteria bacterium HGW-Betaproteobacteria-20]|nr:MAG: GGDEF domain-containing protein [Betaproteobacteria bacterium HGW-Betaproteobacteria-20]
MSLIKQLRIAVMLILIFTATGSLIFSTLGSKSYLEDQLQAKNTDNANALALALTQMQKDMTTIELLIYAQFDSGHYRYIRLFSPDGKVIAEHTNTLSTTKAPDWFVRLVPFEVLPGSAIIQSDWKQFGTLKVESDLNFAYDQLWDATLNVALWILVVGLFSWYFCGYLLRKILKPLDDVIAHAQAIGERKFITIDEPSTLEFRAVVQEMNALSSRIKNTVSLESARLEALRQKVDYDDVTGLMNRDYFIHTMEANLNHEEYDEGALMIFRLSNLAQLDEAMGYPQANAVLKRIGNILVAECREDSALICGRLSGTEFAVFCNQAADEFALANQLKDSVVKAADIKTVELTARFLVVTTKVKKVSEIATLFEVLDSTLNLSSLNDENFLRVINAGSIAEAENNTLIEWENLLRNALLHKRIKLEHFPVNTTDGTLIHYESPTRLQLEENGKWICAGEFIYWATQLNLIQAIDVLVLETAIASLALGAKPLCLNVSASAMSDRKYVQQTVELIQQNLQHPNCLNFEVSETAVFDHLSEFKYFCSQLKAAGCHVGVEHVSLRIARLGELHDIGLDYIKFDASIIRGINTNEANKALLRGLCVVAHSIGIKAIAEGVKNNDEIDALKEIGIDGITGPGVKI